MSREWYETFFQGVASEFWNELATAEYTNIEGGFLLKVLNLPEGAKILDAPSGRGRLALWLAQHGGFFVEAWDIEEKSISRLNEEACSLGLNVLGVQADLVKKGPTGETFDGAVCLGNCFGYFDAEGMTAFIKNISDSLKTGGKWVIQSGMLAESIFPNWEDDGKYKAAGMKMEIENAYNPVESRMEIQASFKKNGKSEKLSFCHYIYTLKEVHRMLAEAGLKIVGMYGGCDDRDFALGDEQIYIVAEKIKE